MKDCNSGHENYGETIGKSEERRRGNFFLYKRNGILGEAVINKVLWRKLSVVAFDWLGCDGLSFPELFAGQGEDLSSSHVVVE